MYHEDDQAQNAVTRLPLGYAATYLEPMTSRPCDLPDDDVVLSVVGRPNWEAYSRSAVQ
jgi:hypothetical protein